MYMYRHVGRVHIRTVPVLKCHVRICTCTCVHVYVCACVHSYMCMHMTAFSLVLLCLWCSILSTL